MAHAPVIPELRLISPWAQNAEDLLEAQPWSEFAQKYGVDLDLYKTPFCVMAELLERWPMMGSTLLTSEHNDKERFKRLIEVIGGYPLIGGGYRPLDFPAHPLSKPALMLSSYLDSIKVNMAGSGWPSVRSHALMYDLTRRKKGEIKYTRPLKNLTSFLLHNIILHEKRFSNGEEAKTGTLHWSKFLTVLHSHAHNKEGFWPPKLGEKLVLDGTMHKDIFDFQYHEFKLKKIQTWIKHWSRGVNKVPLGIRQNFLIGPSVILESIFVRVRSYILKEYGMGSICIDGGGRVAFLSTKSREHVHNALEEFLYFSFLDVEKGMDYHQNGNREHRHPYTTTISEAMNTYILASGKEFNREAFKNFIGKDAMQRLLPAFSIEPDVPEVETEECSHKLEYQHDMSLTTENCALCEDKEIESLTEKNCTDVCAMHWLIHEIAKTSKIRNASLRSQPGPTDGMWEEQYGQISDVVALDGNSLGQIFLAPYDWKLAPLSFEENDPLATLIDEIPKVWNQFCEQNASLRQQMDPDEKVAWEKILEQNEIDSSKLSKLMAYSEKLRLDALFRLTRRSFSFNANWALAFQKVIYAEDSGLFPWIYAGDDIVLVNRKGGQEDVGSRLDKFHQELNNLLGDCNISFAGGWVTKSQEYGEIQEMLDGALENERLAKHTWKGQIKEGKTFKEMLGTKTHCKVCFESGKKWLQEQKSWPALVYENPKEKPHSLILKVSREDLQTLAQKKPSSYDK